MEQQSKVLMPSNKLGIIYGFGTGIVLVIYNFLLQVLNVQSRSLLYYVVIAIFLAGVLAFCYAFSRREENDTTFGGIFKGGFRMVAIVILVLVVATVITVVADPSIKADALKSNEAAMTAAKRSPAEIAQSMKSLKDNFVLMQVMGIVFSYIFYGVVFAAIGAALFRKNKA